MTKIIVRTEGHYEVHETPFSRAYEWYPACVVLECKCGEKLALTGSSTAAACRQCGANHSSVIQDIQEREGRLQHETTHPWYYDLQSQADQHLQDEVAYVAPAIRPIPLRRHRRTKSTSRKQSDRCLLKTANCKLRSRSEEVG